MSIKQFRRCISEGCSFAKRDRPGATRCWQHRPEETLSCAAHDKPGCRDCFAAPKESAEVALPNVGEAIAVLG